jgi:hypothetical protein
MMDRPSISQSSASEERWGTACGKLPKREIIYFCQVVAIYIIIIACIVNLSLGSDKDSLWASMLSGCIGYLLPSPKIQKNKNDALLHDPAE